MLKLLNFYAPRGLRIKRAFRQYVWDEAGRRYVDAHTGHGVAFLGHNNPEVVSALKEQLSTFTTAPQGYSADVIDEALNNLSRVAPRGATHVTLLNSGAEAVELAIKIARRATGRKSLTAFTGSFHGRTMGALSLTHNPRYRRPFEPLLREVRFGRFNDPGSVDDVITEETAAVFIEPVQGEGGVRPASTAFAKAVARRVEEIGALLVIDEIQSGFGRTGRVWAHEKFGVDADIVLAGKAIGGGFPVSAVFLKKDIASSLRPGDHGSTYGGNPLAWAAISAASEVLVKDSVPLKAGAVGRVLLRSLEESLTGCRGVRDVRGEGLMIGVELRFLPTEVIRCAQENGVLVLRAGATVVRLLPPYMITPEDIGVIADVIGECVERASNGWARQAS